MPQRSVKKTTLALGILLSMGAAGGWLVACSSNGGSEPRAKGNDPQGQEQDGRAGTVGLSITLPNGDLIGSVTFTLTDSSGALVPLATPNPGTIATNNSQSIAFQIGGVPAGSGDTIALDATTAMGNKCHGSASGINITAQATTNVTVQLVCSSPGSDAGNVFVSGTAAYCGAWTALSSGNNGSEVYVGGTVTLTVTATGPDPAHLGYTWSQSTADGGIIGTLGSTQDENAGPSDTNTFLCNAPGQTTITVVVDDGPIPDGGSCPANLTTATMKVGCDPVPADH